MEVPSTPEWSGKTTPANLTTVVQDVSKAVTNIGASFGAAQNIRDLTLAKATNWYNKAKDSDLDIGKLIQGATTAIKAFGTKGSKNPAKDVTVKSVQDFITQVLKDYGDLGEVFKTLVNGVPGISQKVKDDISKKLVEGSDQVTLLKNLLLAVLNNKEADEEFLTQQKNEILVTLVGVKKSFRGVFDYIKSLGLDPALTITFLGGLAALASDPAGSFKYIEDFAKSLKIEMLMTNPIVGTLENFKEEVLRVLNSTDKAGPEEKKNVYGLVVLFSVGNDTVGALQQWLQRTILFVSDHKATFTNIIKALNSPQASAIGGMVSKEFQNYLSGKGVTIGKDISKLTQNIPKEVKDSFGELVTNTGGFLKDLTTSKDPIGQFFQKEKDETKAKLEKANSGSVLGGLGKAESLVRKVGGKELLDSAGKTISAVANNTGLDNKWLTLKSANDLFGYAGTQLENATGVTKDVTNIGDALGNVVKLVLDKVTLDSKKKTELNNEAIANSQSDLDKILTSISDIKFDTFVVPPQEGQGLGVLRSHIQEHITENNTSAPVVAKGSAIFGTVLVVSGPHKSGADMVFNALLSQIERI